MNINELINEITDIENKVQAQKISRNRLEAQLTELQVANNELADQLDTCLNAVGLLTTLSDGTVMKSCDFISDTLNAALERIFTSTRKRVKIVEGLRGGIPQLELELYEDDDSTPLSLRDDSGHGVTQIISLLCTLCIIAITGKRKFFAMDEVTSGLSAKARATISDILNEFTKIGFQFIVSEHGFVPSNSKVYVLENNGSTSRVVRQYIEEDGVFLGDNLVAPAKVRNALDTNSLAI